MKKKNKHHVSYYWRGDIEDLEEWAFPTAEEAWNFVKGKIQKSINMFKEDEKDPNHGPTKIDFDKMKRHLFEGGKTEDGDVVYCQCSAWWDNWYYWKEES